ncbi:MAG: GNAT family N-acetyltransferase [Candidatus Hodarchaeales archaeon]
MKYNIEEFDPKQASKEFWETYFKFTDKIAKEQNPDDPLPNRERVIKNQTTDYPDYKIKRWLVFTEKRKIIGWAGIGYPTENHSSYEKNQHILSGSINIDSDYRRQGIGTALLKKICEVAIENNKTIIESGTDTEEGLAFSKKLGGSVTLEGAESRLKFSDVDWELMKEWTTKGKNITKDVTIETFTSVPEEDIEDYVKFYTELLHQMPWGDVDSRPNITPESRRKDEKNTKERGIEWIAKITRESNGTVSGLTDIFYNPLENHRVDQGLTGVKKEFRGRGLGKWLKAAMLLYIKDKYPEIKYISTGNADVNVPMLAINTQMGFKRYKSGSSIKFEVEELRKRLGK